MVAVGLVALLVLGRATGAGAAEDGVQFLDPLSNEPLEIELPPDSPEAVEQFHATGENPYAGDEGPIAEGGKIYGRWCQACHLPDGSGRIGPNVNDDQWKYARTGTAVGQFEIIYAGGAGAMQAFGTRLDQDEILKVIAFLETLQKE
jgi:cytochrome c-L